MRTFFVTHKKTFFLGGQVLFILIFILYGVPILFHIGTYIGSFLRYVFIVFYKLAYLL